MFHNIRMEINLKMNETNYASIYETLTGACFEVWQIEDKPRVTSAVKPSDCVCTLLTTSTGPRGTLVNVWKLALYFIDGIHTYDLNTMYWKKVVFHFIIRLFYDT